MSLDIERFAEVAETSGIGLVSGCATPVELAPTRVSVGWVAPTHAGAWANTP